MTRRERGKGEGERGRGRNGGEDRGANLKRFLVVELVSGNGFHVGRTIAVNGDIVAEGDQSHHCFRASGKKERKQNKAEDWESGAPLLG